MFNKILIANRGEIAVRVARAARELGVRSVAVYSEADRLAPHVMAADEAYAIGASPSSESYLRVEALLEAARRSGADAVHPGYGFLSERASFIRAVESAGLVFIGPPADAVEAMGDKREARKRAIAAGVPVVPGTTEALVGAEDGRATAEQIGYPVVLKAAAGGGGKGMRVVRSAEEMEQALLAAQGEARAAFGDDAVYMERFLDRPRHIEIQVLADGHGTVVHLGERECSIQRRHQKLIEEAPSAVLTPEERGRMGEAAVAATRAVGYRGAGTIEYLYQEGDYFFLEMNTRIQVEHPVTEMVTGLDLVQLQIRIAAGEPLPFTQGEVAWTGHALECRITAEDPANSFFPSTGTIRALQVPSGPGVRWDGAIAAGQEVTLFYDPMLAKLVVHAPTRVQAIDRMKRALGELVVTGIDTSTPFHLRVMDEPDFRAGRLSIRYLEEHEAGLVGPASSDDAVRVAALAGALLEHQARKRPAVVRPSTASGHRSSWTGRTGWRGR